MTVLLPRAAWPDVSLLEYAMARFALVAVLAIVQPRTLSEAPKFAVSEIKASVACLALLPVITYSATSLLCACTPLNVASAFWLT